MLAMREYKGIAVLMQTAVTLALARVGTK